MQFWTVTGVPVGTNDINGIVIVNNSRVTPTRKGVFCYQYGEIIEPFNDAPHQTITMTWPRFLLLTQAYADEPLNIQQLASLIADAYPVSEINKAVIVDALTSPEGHAAFVELLDQDEVRAILAEEAEYAEDH